jgi:hypothetical protein
MNYLLTDEQLKQLNQFNRSKGQSNFLYNLLDGDFDELVLLEMIIKANSIFWVPDTREEVDKIFNMIK